MIRYFIKLSYKGTQFHGWQIQPNAITVQQELNKALKIILKDDINIVGAGRTDTGVHAKTFYAHFDLDNEINQKLLNKLDFKLNAIIHDDIAIDKVYKVTNDLHTRFSAIKRVYKYFIIQSKNPFEKDTAWFLTGKTDIDLMNKAAKELFNYTDFTSFSKLHTQTKTNNCKIYHAEWTYEDDKLVFTISADRFLRNMVRAIVGTLIEVGQNKLSINDFKKIIEMKNRSKAGASVPAHGLFLWDVVY